MPLAASHRHLTEEQAGRSFLRRRLYPDNFRPQVREHDRADRAGWKRSEIKDSKTGQGL
jgi:hypothetical protein